MAFQDLLLLSPRLSTFFLNTLSSGNCKRIKVQLTAKSAECAKDNFVNTITVYA